jgi:hypothetical protein
VSKKYSQQFAADVSWQRVDASGMPIEDDDITEDGGGASGIGDNSGGDDSGSGSGLSEG